MTDLLSHQIRTLEAAASVLCTQCLRDEIADNAEALPELTLRLMRILRHSKIDVTMERYAEAAV